MGTTRPLLALVAAALVLSVAPAGAVPPPASITAPPGGAQIPFGRTIIVQGRGLVEAAPDRALVTVGAQLIRPSAQEAQARVSAIMNDVLTRVSALGIPRERIRTVEISLFPQRRPQSEEISGYQAVQRALVTVDDLALVGRTIDAAVAAGANVLDNVFFVLRDASTSRAQAYTAAVRDARAAADALAAAAGVTISRLVRIEEVTGGAPVRGVTMQATPGISTPVFPGTLAVSVSVRAVFAF